MYIETKEYRLQFLNNQFSVKDGETIIMELNEPMAYIVNLGPPHDHNDVWKFDKDRDGYLYLEEYKPNRFDISCNIVSEEICPHYNGSHIGKDCSCKTGFINRPKLHKGKLILDLGKIL